MHSVIYLSREKRSKLYMTLFFLLMSVIMLFPLIWAFSTSLKTDKDALVNSFSLVPKEGVHFENYIEVFSIIPYLTYLSNTIFVSVFTIIMGLNLSRWF